MRPYSRTSTVVCSTLAATALMIGLTACSSPGPDVHAFMTVSPAVALMDAPVTVTVSGLAPGSTVDISASATDYQGTAWSSSATFVAGSSGEVSLASPSLGGSYEGVHPMGLFEVMTPAKPSRADFIGPVGGYSVALTAKVDNRTVATATAQRQLPGQAGVTDSQIGLRTSGIYADMATPSGSTGSPARRPAVLVFGGSEGGIDFAVSRADLFAAHGYPALALAYFKEPGLPSDLLDIPLEYFVKGLQFLAHQPGVDPNRLVVMGVSRGSEAALLLGVHYPQIVHGVIAGVPSSHANPGTGGVAWTIGGKPVPTPDRSDAPLPVPPSAPDSVFPVETINGPVLTICGGHDLLWDSCAFSAAIQYRLVQHHFPFPHPDLGYPDAGHSVGSALCYFSMAALATGDAANDRGGTPLANGDGAGAANAAILGLLQGLNH